MTIAYPIDSIRRRQGVQLTFPDFPKPLRSVPWARSFTPPPRAWLTCLRATFATAGPSRDRPMH